MMRPFLRVFLLSYNLKPCFFCPVLIGGMETLEEGGSGWGCLEWEACFAVSDEPVSIWTTCLKAVVSAWTNVVGYGLVSDLEMGFGVRGGVWSWVPLLLLLLTLLFGEFTGDETISLSWSFEFVSIVDGFG